MGTYIVGALVLAAAAFAARKIYRDRKSGGCAGCPSEGQCRRAHECGCDD